VPEIKSTRLRHISATSLNEAEAAVGLLPFKVEHKQTVFAGERWYIIFTVPDNAPADVASADLD
jgi:hypothetical protein